MKAPLRHHFSLISQWQSSRDNVVLAGRGKQAGLELLVGMQTEGKQRSLTTLHMPSLLIQQFYFRVSSLKVQLLRYENMQAGPSVSPV